MNKLHIRFYEELNDHISADRKKRRFEYEFMGYPSVKDIIESLGVPHGEVDMILVNGKSVDFSYNIKNGDDLSVYPVFESIDVLQIQHLREKPLRNPKFVLDVHLGTLAKYLRMLGFDTLYQNNYNDNEIINISLNEIRTILTKDKGILKQNNVSRGYYIRNTNPEKQLEEVLFRFDLNNSINEFTRCLECNTLLESIKKEKIKDKIPPKVEERQNEFYICKNCNKIYWPGSHYQKMKKMIARVIK